MKLKSNKTRHWQNHEHETITCYDNQNYTIKDFMIPSANKTKPTFAMRIPLTH
jgi:hypothetical protein